MPWKGVVIVPSTEGPLQSGRPAPGTQRVANRPIVCHVIDALGAPGADDVAVVGPPEALGEIRKSVDNVGVRRGEITYLAQTGRRDLAGALLTAAEFVGDACCVVHSAVSLVGQSLEPFATRFDRNASEVMLLFGRGSEARDRLGPRTQRMIGITELSGSKARLALAGVCLLGPGVLRRACIRLEELETGLDLNSIVERIALGGKKVEAGFVHTWHRYNGNPLDLLELNRIVLDQQTAADEPFGGIDNHIEGRVIIHPTADVRSSVVLGPSIIGAGARILSSYIGPYTSIGTDTYIEGAEIERSIIEDAARIIHVGGRIAGSTVGQRASIFRDFALPRAVRLHVGDDVEVALN